MHYHSYYTNKGLTSLKEDSWTILQTHFDNFRTTAIRIAPDVGDESLNGKVRISLNSFTDCTSDRYVGYLIKCNSATYHYITFVNTTTLYNPCLRITGKTSVLASQSYIEKCNANGKTANKDVMTFVTKGIGSVNHINISHSVQGDLQINICGAWLKLEGTKSTGSFKFYLHYHCKGEFLMGAVDSIESKGTDINNTLEKMIFFNGTSKNELVYTQSFTSKATITLDDVKFIQCNSKHYFSPAIDETRFLTILLINVQIDHPPVNDFSHLGTKVIGSVIVGSPIAYPEMGKISVHPETLTADLDVFIARGISMKSILYGIFTVSFEFSFDMDNLIFSN